MTQFSIGTNMGFAINRFPEPLKYLIYEPMSCPRENAWTWEETLRLRDRVNEDAAIPMEVCLELGHAPHPDQRDPLLWIRNVGAVSPVIHVQQPESGHSLNTDYIAYSMQY